MSARPYGQHFLRDDATIDRIVAAAQLEKTDRVLEIGPGRGALTIPLCLRAKQVVAYEIDPVLARQLTRFDNLEVVQQDFLEANLPERLPGEGWKVVANLPYYVTTPILERLLLQGRPHVSEMWLMMQHEVAQRIVSPATRESGSLTYFAHFYSEPSYLFQVPPEAFSPPPKVHSAVVHFRMRQELPCARPQRFFQLVRSAFHARRKMLSSSLRGLVTAETFARAGIDPRRRPETLQMAEFLALEEAWGEQGEP